MARVERRDEFLAADVKAMKLEIAYADFILQEEATDKIVVSMTRDDEKGTSYTCELENGVLQVLTEGVQIAVTLSGKNKGFHKEEIEKDSLIITVPTGMKLDEMELELGAGSTQFANTSTCYTEMKMEVGAGKLKASRMNVEEKATVTVGAGSVELADFFARDAKMECGAGSMKIMGAVERDMKVSCGVGAVELCLDAVEEDYNYSIECGIGSVVINGSKRGGLFASGSKVCNPNAKGAMKLECGVGKIELITRKRLAAE